MPRSAEAIQVFFCRFDSELNRDTLLRAPEGDKRLSRHPWVQAYVPSLSASRFEGLGFIDTKFPAHPCAVTYVAFCMGSPGNHTPFNNQ